MTGLMGGALAGPRNPSTVTCVYSVQADRLEVCSGEAVQQEQVVPGTE